MHNVIVTGIPRSGTTLTAALIDSLPDAVCLNEPAWQGVRPRSAGEYVKWLAEDFARIRQRLFAGEPVPDRRSPEGAAVTDYWRGDAAPSPVPFIRPGLSPDFTLAIKHNGPYLAVLEKLIALGCFTVIAVVRHPVPVIHSWRSLDLPISRGEMPGAVAYWPRMAALINTPMDLLEKQVRMYDLMCERLHASRAGIHLLTYEALVESPTLLSACLGVSDAPPAARLVAKSGRNIPEGERRVITEAVRSHGQYYRKFYPEA